MNVDVSPFFAPGGGLDTQRYATLGLAAFSQAANAMEALETGTSLFVIDEDTTAADLVTRVAHSGVVPPEGEGRTFVDLLPVFRDVSACLRSLP